MIPGTSPGVVVAGGGVVDVDLLERSGCSAAGRCARSSLAPHGLRLRRFGRGALRGLPRFGCAVRGRAGERRRRGARVDQRQLEVARRRPVDSTWTPSLPPTHTSSVPDRARRPSAARGRGCPASARRAARCPSRPSARDRTRSRASPDGQVKPTIENACASIRDGAGRTARAGPALAAQRVRRPAAAPAGRRAPTAAPDVGRPRSPTERPDGAVSDGARRQRHRRRERGAAGRSGRRVMPQHHASHQSQWPLGPRAAQAQLKSSSPVARRA